MSGETCCWKLGWPKYFGINCYSSTSCGLCGSRGASGEHLLFGLMSLNDLKYIEFRCESLLVYLLFLIMLVDEWPAAIAGDFVPSEICCLNDILDLAYKHLLFLDKLVVLILASLQLAYGLNCKFNFEDFFITSSVDVSELKSLLLILLLLILLIFAMFTYARVFRKGAGLFWCLTRTSFPLRIGLWGSWRLWRWSLPKIKDVLLSSFPSGLYPRELCPAMICPVRLVTFSYEAGSIPTGSAKA